jgi:hypothetical protein
MSAGRKFRHRGKKRDDDKFIMLPSNLFVRPEFAGLPPAARVILVDMAKLYRPPWKDRPGNNGKLWYGCRQGAAARADIIWMGGKAAPQIGQKRRRHDHQQDLFPQEG